jgi:hypothetical protein
MAMRKYWTFILVSFPMAVFAYWAPNHIGMNWQIWNDGKPFGAGFKRGDSTVSTGRQYLQRVLYLNVDTPVSFIVPKALVPLNADQAKKQTICDLQNSARFSMKGVEFKNASINPGTDKPTDKPSKQLPANLWVACGGLWEDGFTSADQGARWGGRRAVNHFHDPLSTSGGYTGLNSINVASGLPFVDLLRPGISATEWVDGKNSGGPLGDNNWGYKAIGESWHRAFTEETLEMRTSAISAALRATGQVMHLVEDETVPDHARDLPHPGDGFEEFMQLEQKDKFHTFPESSWIRFPLKIIAAEGLKSIWDRDIYSTNADSTLGSVTPGLSEYVNANFLAWNRHSSGLEFSSIPSATGSGFSDIFTVIPLLPLRVNPHNYPWPKLQPLFETRYPSSPGSYVLASAANNLPTMLPSPGNGTEAQSTRGAHITGESWQHYVDPLMARAHGYAETIVALALQPARAEIVPEINAVGLDDSTGLRIRLTNLWPPTSDNAVTWHIEELTFVALHTEKVKVNIAQIPGIDVKPIVVPGAFDVAPGETKSSMLIKLTPGQRASINLSSHTAILVKAHLGDSVKTPLLFSVPIPSSLAVVQQKTLTDTTAPYVFSSGNCRTGCGEDYTEGTARNPRFQTLSGTIDLVPTELDVLQRKASDEVKLAMKRDAKIVAVGLVNFAGVNHDLIRPNHAINSRLTLSSSDFVQASPGFWIRNENSFDSESTSMSFDATVDLKDFVDALDDNGLRVSYGLALAVFTSQGGLRYQGLAAWPWFPKKTLPEAATNAPRGLCSSDWHNGFFAVATSSCTGDALGTSCNSMPRRSVKDSTWHLYPSISVGGQPNPNLGLEVALRLVPYWARTTYDTVSLSGQIPLRGAACQAAIALGREVVCALNGEGTEQIGDFSIYNDDQSSSQRCGGNMPHLYSRSASYVSSFRLAKPQAEEVLGATWQLAPQRFEANALP